MQSTILTENNIIEKLIIITSKILNIETFNYQVKKVNIINYEDINNANIRFVEMMNIRL